jgi:hypothetical protein
MRSPTRRSTMAADLIEKAQSSWPMHHLLVSRQIDPLIGLRPPSPQHPCNAQILVEVRPMDTHRHDLKIGALFCGRALEPRVPIERSDDLATIRERHDKLSRPELDRTGAQIADVNFQSSHSRPPAVVRGLAADVEQYR